MKELFDEQRDFNKNFFPPPANLEEQEKLTKEYVLLMASELQELLSCVNWKPHRRKPVVVNREHVAEELTDLLKYWVSLCVIWNISPEDALANFWRKSMVVRQRHSEEYVQKLEGKILVCDIDGVLCDYARGFADWLVRRMADSTARELVKRALEQPDAGIKFLDASSLKMPHEEFGALLHEFRVTRGKVNLPVYPYAKQMLETFRSSGHKIVLLTSRPIALYPNLYTDTMEWLRNNDLPFDFIWWDSNKGKHILDKGLSQKITWYIEDSLEHVETMAGHCENVVWINRLRKPMIGLPNHVQILWDVDVWNWVNNMGGRVNGR